MIVTFLIGVAVGAGVMFYAFRNGYIKAHSE